MQIDTEQVSVQLTLATELAQRSKEVLALMHERERMQAEIAQLRAMAHEEQEKADDEDTQG